MKTDYTPMAKAILAGVGGTDNIASATHCMTRLRLTLKDRNNIDEAALKSIAGVRSVIRQGAQLQIVVGAGVGELFAAFTALTGPKEGNTTQPKAEGPIIHRLAAFVADCMTPLLPAMLGCGMLKVLLTLLMVTGLMDESGSTYLLVYAFADCFYTFLPVFLGYTVARKLGGSPILFMTVGAALCYPDLCTLMGVEAALEYGTFFGLPCVRLFGLPVLCTTYTSSVLPMLLMGPVMKWAEGLGERYSPAILRSFLKPMLFLLLCIPFALVVLGPLGNLLGNVFSGLFALLYGTVPWLTVGLVSALMPFIVMTGMHYALLPLCVNNLAVMGFDALVLVTMFCSNLAQGGAALGTAVRTRDRDIRSEGIASGISAIFAGVTEPAMYGINLRFRRPLAAAVAAAGAGGLFCGLASVRSYVMGGAPSLFSLITFIDNTPDTANPFHSVVFGAVAAVLVLLLSFGLTLILFREDPTGEGDEELPEAPAPWDGLLCSPMSGEVFPLEEIPDEVFRTGALGEGLAVLPEEGVVVSPCDGVVSTTVFTGHAVGVTCPNGMEVLIHVGLDTVALRGEPFTYTVQEGDAVKAGDVLLRFDRAAILAAGYSLHTPLVINTAEGEPVPVTRLAGDTVRAGEPFLRVEP